MNSGMQKACAEAIPAQAFPLIELQNNAGSRPFTRRFRHKWAEK